MGFSLGGGGNIWVVLCGALVGLHLLKCPLTIQPFSFIFICLPTDQWTLPKSMFFLSFWRMINNLTSLTLSSLFCQITNQIKFKIINLSKKIEGRSQLVYSQQPLQQEQGNTLYHTYFFRYCPKIPQPEAT